MAIFTLLTKFAVCSPDPRNVQKLLVTVGIKVSLLVTSVVQHQLLDVYFAIDTQNMAMLLNFVQIF